MQRTVEPEILDSLPPDHPVAQHNRRDLRLLNAVLGNHRWLARTLPSLLRPGERVLELGAGTGELCARLLHRGIAIDALDLWPAPPAWPARAVWHRADLRDFSGYAAYSVFAGNLIFHQFDAAELAALGATLRRSARVIVACEPARRPFSRHVFRTLAPLFGAHPATLHDADVSIAAGFLADELPRALGLAAPDWSIDCSLSPLGLYRLIAVRSAQNNPLGYFARPSSAAGSSPSLRQ